MTRVSRGTTYLIHIQLCSGTVTRVSRCTPYLIHIQYHKKQVELIYKDCSKLFVRFIRNNLNPVVHILA